MKQIWNKCYAEVDNQFVLTEAGYEKTPDSVRSKRKVGKPIRHFEKIVPALWVSEGWVIEVPAEPEWRYKTRLMRAGR